MSYQSQRVSGFGTTIFAEMSALAAQHKAINLGQGFPDFDGPDEVKAAAIKAIEQGINQYAISTGAASLREAIYARHQSALEEAERRPRTLV